MLAIIPGKSRAALPWRGRAAEPIGLGDSGSPTRVQLHALLSHVQYHEFLARDLDRLARSVRQHRPRQRQHVRHCAA
jgi:hypothetical protein